jgi:hypothetical protein
MYHFQKLQINFLHELFHAETENVLYKEQIPGSLLLEGTHPEAHHKSDLLPYIS